ncbi:4Fe-4S binding protein [bacterium]|nr:4Fe-4S binding protein [bacterium]
MCIYGAARPAGKVHTVARETCVGCGLCAELCPASAIAMTELAEPRGFTLGVK